MQTSFIKRLALAVCLSVMLLYGSVWYSGFNNVRVSGSQMPTTIPLSGAWLTWNHLAQGESDFVNVYGSGPGGFQWYNVPTGGTIGTRSMALDSSGNLTLNQTATMSGLTVDGNSQMNGTLTVTSGITGHVNQITYGHSGGCGVTAGVSYGQCFSVVTWNNAFTDTNYAASCLIINPFGSPAIAGAVKATGSITVYIRNGTANGDGNSGGALDCIATEN